MFSQFASFVGAPRTRTILSIVTCGALLYRRRTADALLVATAVAGAGVLNSTLKKIVQRPRPRQAHAGGASFPSGHTSGTSALSAVGVYLLWRSERRRPAIALATLLLPVCALIARSRLVLHEHHPTDLAGGVALGVGWVAALAVASQRLEGRRDSKV